MDFLKLLEQAIIYIESRIGEDIKVEEVAAAVGYSYHHFNRRFSAILGESVGSYIKKRRLAAAAKSLLYTDSKIIDIALANGFESPEAFSRAFKFVYKTTPMAYRNGRIDSFVAAKESLDARLLDHLARNLTVHPKIAELKEPIKVVGLRGETTLADNRLPELWKEFNSRVAEIPGIIPGGRGFGICEASVDNTLYTMSNRVMFTEVAGAEVFTFENTPDAFVKKVLPVGRYAVFTHRGSLSMLPQTFSYIWGTWFLTCKYELDAREDFELYDDRFSGYDNPDSEIDLYIPVK